MRWLIPTLVYIAAIGALGITVRLAARTLDWQDIILWTGVGYVFVVLILLALGQTELRVVSGSGWAILSGALAIGGAITLYLALGTGEASKVVPISAAYPAVTLVLAAIFLAEGVSLLRWVGAFVVIGGVLMISIAH